MKTSLDNESPSTMPGRRSGVALDDDDSHPVGTAIGAVVGGAATGAAVASVAGPVGTIAGAAVGAVVGAMAGQSLAEAVDPVVEEAYWRENFTSRPYISPSYTYGDYWPAFGLGVAAFNRYPGRPYDEIEPELSRDWPNARADSRLDWDRAKAATRDAWTRLSDATERAVPGDSDRDGK